MRWSQETVDRYFAEGGDQKWRLDHYHDPDPTLIVEIGAHEGEFTEKLAQEFPNAYLIIAFEPVISYCERAKERLAEYKNVLVLPFGLWDRDTNLRFAAKGPASGVDEYGQDTVELRDIATLGGTHDPNDDIDLMIMNVEGAEYALLRRLILSGMIQDIRDLQIQFHDNGPAAYEQMTLIQKLLARTHYLTYQYPFCMENWRRRGN